MDENSFKELAMAELNAVYRLACRLANGAEQADDFVQETYLHAFRSAATFTLGGYGIRPWLFRILHNVIYDRRVADRRDKLLIEGLLHARSGTSTADTGGTPTYFELGEIDWESVDERLKTAINSLPMDNRVAFLLSVAEGLKYREISEVTGVPVGTVMSRLYRAREMLAAKLTDLAVERRLGR